jgi:hypothetical protein
MISSFSMPRRSRFSFSSAQRGSRFVSAEDTSTAVPFVSLPSYIARSAAREIASARVF